MPWPLVALAALMFFGVAMLAWHAKRAADRQRRMWSDEEVKLLHRRADPKVPPPANDGYPEVWPVGRSGSTQ